MELEILSLEIDRMYKSVDNIDKILNSIEFLIEKYTTNEEKICSDGI